MRPVSARGTDDRLVGDLADVASIEAGLLAATREMGDPTTVVAEAVDAFQVQAATAGLALAAEVAAPTSPKLSCKATAAASVGVRPYVRPQLIRPL